MNVYDLPLNYKEESKNGVYIFTVAFTEELYDKLNFNDIVIFNAGEKKVIAKIYNIYYFVVYHKYYCKEVK